MNYFYRLLELVFNFPSLILSEILSLFGFKVSDALEYGWYLQNIVYLIILILFILKILKKKVSPNQTFPHKPSPPTDNKPLEDEGK